MAFISYRNGLSKVKTKNKRWPFAPYFGKACQSFCGKFVLLPGAPWGKIQAKNDPSQNWLKSLYMTFISYRNSLSKIKTKNKR
jgi:hypothetical protein